VIAEVARVLNLGGLFFCYTPGKGSTAWKNHAPAKKIDGSTLDGISRETSPYFPSPHPFRFVTQDELAEILNRHGFDIQHAETVTRTYRNGSEIFEFIVVEARLSRL
jgi:hypothetical protein